MSTYEISKSSLLSLKSEILRKHQEIAKVKVENEIKIKTFKKSPLEIKNKGVEARDEKVQDDIDQDLLRQSKSVLEYKAELYKKLSGGNFSEEDKKNNKLYLVRFDQKNANKISKVSDLPPSDSESDTKATESEEDHYQSDEDENQNPEERWVDYIDCFGRTRRCMQKDLEYLKSKDAELKIVVEKKNQPKDIIEEEKPDENSAKNMLPNENNSIKSDSDQSELMSSDMRRELLRQQWEHEEQEVLNKKEVHYQDILFGEARSHGVGYYGFSKDEEERRKQQAALKNIRKETEDKQKKAKELKESREKILAARLKAARNRKRARMGLPPEEDEPTPAVTKPETSEEELKMQQEREARERILEESRKNHVRPWDIGKEGVKEHQVMSQEEWVKKKREERPDEFAPPTNYRKNFRAEEKIPSTELKIDEKTLNFTSKKKLRKPDRTFLKNETETKTCLKNAISDMEKLERTKQSSVRASSDCNNPLLEDSKKLTNVLDTDSNFDCDDTLLKDYENGISSTSKRLDGGDYLNYQDTLEDASTENERKRKGVEVAPPPTYDYYGPGKSKIKRNTMKGPNIQDSIEAGLKFLRKQVEEKEKPSKRLNDMFLF